MLSGIDIKKAGMLSVQSGVASKPSVALVIHSIRKFPHATQVKTVLYQSVRIHEKMTPSGQQVFRKKLMNNS